MYWKRLKSIYSLNEFHRYKTNSSLLTKVTVLYIGLQKSSCRTKSMHPFSNISTPPMPLVPDNRRSILCFCEFDLFMFSHMRGNMWCLSSCACFRSLNPMPSKFKHIVANQMLILKLGCFLISELLVFHKYSGYYSLVRCMACSYFPPFHRLFPFL